MNDALHINPVTKHKTTFVKERWNWQLLNPNTLSQAFCFDENYPCQ